MRALRVALYTLLVFLCVACGGNFEIQADLSQAIYVTVLPQARSESSWSISPGTPEHARLTAWLRANKFGWSNYYATNPKGGLFVSAGDWSLQFLDGSVIACAIGRSCVWKNVPVSEYDFLLLSRPKSVA